MQRGPKKAALLSIVCSVLILTGCAQGLAFQSEPGVEAMEPAVATKKLVVVYYSTREGNYLVPVRAKIPDGDHFVRRVVEKLLAGSEDKELLASPFPTGVLLRDVYVKNGIACVDLGGDVIQDVDQELWQRAMDSLILTLTELPDEEIKSVEVLINGQSQSSTLLEYPDHVNLIAAGDIEDSPTTTVFFSYNDTYLIPVTITIDSDVVDPITFTLERLVAGPQGIPYLSRVFAEGTRVLGYQQEGDLIRLNFSREAVERDTRGNIRRDEQSPTVLALAMTLRSVAGIDRFQILIEGKPLPDFDNPIDVPQSYLDSKWMEPLLDISGS